MEVKRGYKQAEVGIIPEEWEVKTLGELGTVVRGGSPRPAGDPRYFNGDYIPWLTVGSLTNIPEHQIFVKTTSTSLTEEGSKRSRTLSKDTLAIVNSGAKTLGVAKVLSITCCANDGIAALISQRSGERRFLCYYLNSQTKRLREVVAAGNDQLNLNTGRIALISVPYPEAQEQSAIADVLSDLDALLDAIDRLIAKKRDLKQAAMQQLLAGQTRLPGFKGEWEVKRLGELAIFLKGKGLPKSAITPDGAEPCIHYGELFTHYPETIGEIVSRTNGSRDSFRSIANDVLMPTSDVTPRGLAKASCLNVDGVILGGDILVIRSDNRRVFGPFLSYIIRREEDQVLRLVTGSTVYHLYGSDMKKFTFSLPSLAEQAAIAAVLSDMDAELATLKQRREKTRALKQGIMQELLTGKTRLVSQGGSRA